MKVVFVKEGYHVNQEIGDVGVILDSRGGVGIVCSRI